MKISFDMESSFSSPASSSTDSSTESTGKGLVLRNRGMQRGLMARAALYAENVSKANSNVYLGNKNLPKSHPTVLRDVSTFHAKNVEINNNFLCDELHLPQESDRDNPQTSVAAWENDVIMTSSPLCLDPQFKSPGSSETGYKKFSMNGDLDSDVIQEEPDETGEFLETANEQLSFNTTQQLRSGFFRSIKRQYSPILPLKENPNRFHNFSSSDTDSTTGSKKSKDGHTDDSGDSDMDKDKGENLSNSGNMTQLARQKLQQLRRQGPHNLDVSTGLQWIRLELHEMREQDKSLFLQLIKLHTSIKELRSDFNGSQQFDSYDDLHSAASLWWPRRGFSTNIPPDFSSSDGAQIMNNFRHKPPLRRGFSLNYPPTSRRNLGVGFISRGLIKSESLESDTATLSIGSFSNSFRSSTAC